MNDVDNILIYKFQCKTRSQKMGMIYSYVVMVISHPRSHRQIKKKSVSWLANSEQIYTFLYHPMLKHWSSHFKCILFNMFLHTSVKAVIYQ